MSKTSPEGYATNIKTEQLLKDHQTLDISVTLGSATKAARNDPKPPLSSKEWLRTSIEHFKKMAGSSGDPSSSQAVGDMGNPREDDSEDLDGLSDDDSDNEFPWCEQLGGLATLKPSTDSPTVSRRARKQIGGCNAKLIRREKMRESFWFEMEECAQETYDLAYDLFDRYGRLNPEFYEHVTRKGTGVWGNELDHGDLLLFEQLTVDAAHRRRGIGTKLVNAILEKTRKKVSKEVGFFALARPESLSGEVSHLRGEPAATGEAQEDAEKGNLAFWHAMGFRRVGRSSWLAWTDSPGHPSRQLGIAQDQIRPKSYADISLSGKMEQIFQKLADPAIEAAKCIEELAKALPEDFKDQQWLTIDKEGDTLLHIASRTSKTELVNFLLSRVPHLKPVRNKKGYTALETLQNYLECWRTRRSVASCYDGFEASVTPDEFKGFDASDIECLAALERTAALNLSSLSPRDIEAASSATAEQIRRAPPQFDIVGIQKTLRYKYGCTCGQCIGGFISPRMKLALLCVAEMEHDKLDTFMDETGPDWVDDNEELLTHLPGSVRKNFKTNKSMRQGFANMFSHFAKCLEKGRVPSEGEVLDFYLSGVSEWPPVTGTYLQRGGSVAAVANAIFERAMEQDEWAGDGSHRETFGERIDKLVACRNDHEFGFVAGTCGYKRVKPATSRLVGLSGM